MGVSENRSFYESVCKIAVPVALQSMLQSSFSIVDQVMIGQLGSTSIGAVGLAGKFSSIFSIVAAAIGTVAGIMIAQYIGAQDETSAVNGVVVNLLAALGTSVLFMALCLSCPEAIISIYTSDTNTIREAAVYLKVVSMAFVPAAVSILAATWLRCREKAWISLYGTVLAIFCNTGMNYILIFGKFGFPELGSLGAGIATVTAQWLNLVFMLAGCFIAERNKRVKVSLHIGGTDWKQYSGMLFPILVNEFLWAVGENVYSAIYGHLGTESLAAMTLTGPLQGLLIGALSGISGAASVMIGKQLGKKDYAGACRDAKKLMQWGLVGALCLSCLLIGLKGAYCSVFAVGDTVRELAGQILTAFALLAPVKVLNMILGGGIIRSGGDTRTVMYIDLVGTWVFGVPLGLISAFILRVPIPYVYFILSLEEAVRLAVSIVIFRRGKWMRHLA